MKRNYDDDETMTLFLVQTNIYYCCAPDVTRLVVKAAVLLISVGSYC